MSGAWVAVLAAYAAACSHVVTPSAWKYLVPFSSVGSPCMDPHWPGPFFDTEKHPWKHRVPRWVFVSRVSRAQELLISSLNFTRWKHRKYAMMMMMPTEDLICTGCGKDPYHSGTGCLCPPGKQNWVPQKKERSKKPTKGVSVSSERPEVVCACGLVRSRASKAPERLLPCKCGAEACDAKDLER
eukprot:symbB.v1.2.003449.t1/scaffold194.1/size275082/10